MIERNYLLTAVVFIAVAAKGRRGFYKECGKEERVTHEALQGSCGPCQKKNKAKFDDSD